MTVAPAPHLPQNARINARAYPVSMTGRDIFGYIELQGGYGEPWRKVTRSQYMTYTLEGTAQPDGTLEFEARPWAERKLRRAVMSGAGVYQAGLWARLQPGRSAQVLDLDRAALPLNDAGTLAQFLPPAPPVITVDLQAGGGLTMRQIQAAPTKHLREALTAQFAEIIGRALENVWKAQNNEGRGSGMERWIALNEAVLNGTYYDVFGVNSWEVESHTSELIGYVTSSYKKAVKRPDLTREERKQLRKALRKLLFARFKRAPRRHRPRVPRPLYCLPRPPASPQAPPALQ